MKTIFGSSFETPTIILQFSFIAFAVHYLIKTIKDIFQLNFNGFLIIQLVLLSPCLYLHFVANTFLSEALSYPLVLIIVAKSLKMFVDEDLKLNYTIAVLLLLLILIRGQFIALIPVLLILNFYFLYKNKYRIKKVGYILLISLIPVVSGLIEKCYNKIFFGHFVNNTMNYVHLISAPFYLSEKGDANIFTDNEEKDYFILVNQSLLEAGLIQSEAIKLEKDDYAHYLQNFPSICNSRVHEIGLNYFEKRGLNFYEQNIALNKLCSKMVFPLLKKNFNKWVKFYLKGLKTTFGSSKQLILFLMLLLYSIIYFFKTGKNLYKFIIISIIIMLANNALIAFVVHANKRYLFYFDWVIFAIVILLLNEVLKRGLKDG